MVKISLHCKTCDATIITVEVSDKAAEYLSAVTVFCPKHAPSEHDNHEPPNHPGTVVFMMPSGMQPPDMSRFQVKGKKKVKSQMRKLTPAELEKAMQEDQKDDEKWLHDEGGEKLT